MDERFNHCLIAIYYKLVKKEKLKTELGFRLLNNKLQIAENDVFQHNLNQSCRHNQYHFKPNFTTFHFQSVLQLSSNIKTPSTRTFLPLVGLVPGVCQTRCRRDFA
ncbi:Hypothetical_protein [Hexamita inflata]|uniref:Hypothetical_protein n=1 Tax=Hexamita inflata TaxID=28002 RepID=A0AA86UNT4_9EUKA|nr:Hypothetical protein HINF_LOCUS46216 [Hexamita inflata]